MASKEVEDGKVCAALSYILIGIIWYFVDEKMKKNRFAKFHAKQGLVLLIAWVVVWIVLMILGLPLAFFWALGYLIWLVAEICFLVLVVLGFISAVNGKEQELPLIGHLGTKFTF